MKTNTRLRLSAVLGLSLVLTSLGHAEFYQVDVPTTYRIVGNQLDNPPNNLNTLFGALPGLSKVSTYDPDLLYTTSTKKAAGAWPANGQAVQRGEAAYVQASAPTTMFLNGTPISTPVDLTTTIGFDPLHKFYLRTSQIFDPVDMTNAAIHRYTYYEITGTTPLEGVTVYKPLPSGLPAPPATPATTPGSWDIHVFKYGAWSGGEPTIGAGEGVWIGPEPVTTAIPWVFSVTPSQINPDCGNTLTVHGTGFSAGASLELLPLSGATVVCTGPVVNGAGTEMSATVPGGLPAGYYRIVVRNSVTVASLPFAINAGPPLIKSIWPGVAGTCVPAIVTVNGGGFCAGATLVATPTGGGTTIGATSVTVSPTGDLVSGTFDFTSLSAGTYFYNVTVQNPGAGGSATRMGALSVGSIQGWLMPPWGLAFGNCGVTPMAVFGYFCSGDEVRLVPDAGGTVIPGTVTALTTLSTGYGQLTADFNLAGIPAGIYHAEARRGAGAWVVLSGRLTIYDISSCPLVTELAGRTRVGYTRVNTYTVTLRNLSCAPVATSTLTVSFTASDNPVFSAPTAGGVISPVNVVTFNIPALASGQSYPVSFDLLLPNLNSTCTLSAVDSISGCNALTVPIDVVASQDPNGKDGLAGHGTSHTIAGDEVLPYEIHFENLRTATAPAQDVFITDHLDPAQFDLATFSLGEIKFGNGVITPPPGLTSYSEIVAHDRDGNAATTTDQMLVVVNGELVTDPLSPDLGRLTWSYRTLDPLTLASPLDPDLGFLPPNLLPPLGEGSVKFNVKLKPTVAPGTQVGSLAVIIFDANAPIATNPFYNRLATAIPLVIRPNGDLVEIEWSAAAGVFTLEATPQLGEGAVWTPVTTAPVTVGDLQRATVAPAGEQQYFRLRL